MSYRSSASIPVLFAISILMIALYFVLHVLNIPAGTMIDWVVGIVAFWWLTGITTLPWNMYFTAKDLLDEAKSQKKRVLPLTMKILIMQKRNRNYFFELL